MTAESSAVWPADSRLLRSARTAGARSRPPPNWLRLALRKGIAAALKTEGDKFAQVRAKTVLGQVVQGLVNDAQRGKVTAIRLMVSLFDQGEPADGTGTGTFPGAGKNAGNVERNAGPEQTQNAGGTPAVPGEENLTHWDWTEAGEWNFAEIAEREIPPPAQPGYEAAAKRWEETQRRLNEMVERFFERTSEIRERLEAEPPGSALRAAQWRASAEALRASDSFGEPLRSKLLRIADNELAKEERFGAMQTSGAPRFQTQAEEERARRTRWPKIMWIAFLGFGTRLYNADVDTTVGENSQGNKTTTEAPDTG